MKTITKNVLMGAGVIAFAGLAAVGGYFFAKKTSKNSDDTTTNPIEISSSNDAYEDDEDYEDYTDYDYSQMSDFITLGDYKGLKVNKVVPTASDVDDETIEYDLEYYLEEYKEYEDVTDRAIKEADYVTLDYTVTIDGEEIEDLAASEYETIVGEGMLYEDLENALIGLMPDSTKELELTIPEDFEDEEYVGKKGIFNITITGVQECTYNPELTDAFVKEKIDGCNTVAEWKEVIRKEELDYLLDEAKEQLSSDVYTAALAVTEFSDYEGLLKEYPSLYDDKLAEIEENYESYASMFGMSLEEYKDFAGISDEDIAEEVKNAIKGDIMLPLIASKENLTISDAEADDFMNENYADYDFESPDEFLEYYTLEEIKDYLLLEKCYDFLIDNAEITEVTYSDYLDTYEDDDDESSDDIDAEALGE